MPINLTVQVAPGLAAWSYGDTTIGAGEPTTVKATNAVAAGIAAAVHAGSLILVDGDLPADAVEPDEDSLAKQQVADAARHELYPERDQALYGAAPKQPEESDEEHQERVAQTEAEWHDRIEQAAQQAVEGGVA